MNYLIDTNVISELVKPKPKEKVITWFETVPQEALYLSVLTVGEIRKGIEKTPTGKRKTELRRWLEHELSAWFANRLLSIDHAVADRWGRLLSEVKKPMPAIDSLLAATALHYDLCLVTRNRKDFAYSGLDLLDPFNA